MNTQTKLSISDAAALYKKSRATIYKDIKNGNLSRDTDGNIDLSELIRVYGEPKKQNKKIRIQERPIQISNTEEYNQENTISELKNQIHFLKQQLEKAEDREQKANERIDTLLTLIEMKQPEEKIQPVIKKEETESEKKIIEEVKTQPKKGLLKRIFG